MGRNKIKTFIIVQKGVFIGLTVIIACVTILILSFAPGTDIIIMLAIMAILIFLVFFTIYKAKKNKNFKTLLKKAFIADFFLSLRL